MYLEAWQAEGESIPKSSPLQIARRFINTTIMALLFWQTPETL